MTYNKYTIALEEFLETIAVETKDLVKKIDMTFYEDAVRLILEAEKTGNRVHVTGIGKPGHVAGYIASLLSSTGTSTYELHGTEAIHGSSGQVKSGDIVISISNSGETAELKNTVKTLKNNKAKIIGLSGNPESWLAKISDVFLCAKVEKEGGPLNRAPRASIIAELIVLQGLSVVLQSVKDISVQDYIKWHPGGSLGQLEINKDVYKHI